MEHIDRSGQQRGVSGACWTPHIAPPPRHPHSRARGIKHCFLRPQVQPDPTWRFPYLRSRHQSQQARHRTISRTAKSRPERCTMAKKQDDSASEDVQHHSTQSVPSSSTSFEDVDGPEVHTDRHDSVASGLHSYATHYSWSVPFHLFSACGNDGRMCQFSRTVTSRDLSRGIRKMPAQGMSSCFHICIADASDIDTGFWRHLDSKKRDCQARRNSLTSVVEM